jgi:hypothetical protein
LRVALTAPSIETMSRLFHSPTGWSRDAWGSTDADDPTGVDVFALDLHARGPDFALTAHVQQHAAVARKRGLVGQPVGPCEADIEPKDEVSVRFLGEDVTTRVAGARDHVGFQLPSLGRSRDHLVGIEFAGRIERRETRFQSRRGGQRNGKCNQGEESTKRGGEGSDFHRARSKPRIHGGSRPVLLGLPVRSARSGPKRHCHAKCAAHGHACRPTPLRS